MKDGVELPKHELDYDQWLEFFRKQPAGRLSEFERLKNEIPTEGYAALKRWQEISEVRRYIRDKFKERSRFEV